MPEQSSPRISGFTLVRNGVRLDFPLEASIRSILPLCDEVVVNVGRSEDGTLELVRAMADPRIRIVESEWETSGGGRVLAVETLRAMRACRHPWGIYIQADEVLHERGIDALRSAIEANDRDPRVEGLLVQYLHFYGGFDTVATHRRMYRREVRAVRLSPAWGIVPYGDAQGFRVEPGGRKIRARLTGATMFHYGWARPPEAIRAKRAADAELYGWSGAQRRARLGQATFEWLPGIRSFTGQHPAVARRWVEARAVASAGRIAPRRFRWRHLRYWISLAIERVTGHRVFEFRNYELVRSGPSRP